MSLEVWITWIEHHDYFGTQEGGQFVAEVVVD
jgi:hypothetical protein